MSYDFTLLRVKPGADPAEVARMDAGDEDTRPLEPWDEALRKRIIAELRRINPLFELSDDELNDDKTGTQISFFEREASLTMPYWHTGDAAAPAFDVVWKCLAALSGSSGALVYDPQVGRVLDLATDRPLVMRTYAFGAGALASATAPRRPWWKFW